MFVLQISIYLYANHNYIFASLKQEEFEDIKGVGICKSKKDQQTND